MRSMSWKKTVHIYIYIRKEVTFMVTEIRPPKKICKVLQDKCKHQCTPEVSHSFKLILLPSIAERPHNDGHCLLHYKVSKRQKLAKLLTSLGAFSGPLERLSEMPKQAQKGIQFCRREWGNSAGWRGSSWEPGKAAPYRSVFVCLQMKNKKSLRKERLAEIIFVSLFHISLLYYKYWFPISTR